MLGNRQIKSHLLGVAPNCGDMTNTDYSFSAAISSVI